MLRRKGEDRITIENCVEGEGIPYFLIKQFTGFISKYGE